MPRQICAYFWNDTFPEMPCYCADILIEHTRAVDSHFFAQNLSMASRFPENSPRNQQNKSSVTAGILSLNVLLHFDKVH